jgi:protein phosphatase-4 regulatory subunit 3
MGEEVSMPECTTGNLAEIDALISNAPMHQRENIAQHLLNQDGAYLAKLLSIFEDLEDVEDKDSLLLMFKIFRGVMLLNESNLVEYLFSAEVVLKVAGPFEYDPQQQVGHGNHRDYLSKIVNFKEVVPIKNADIVSRIHQNFRIQYFKDQILRHTSALDDQIFTTLNQLSYFNDMEIVTHLIGDSEYITALFQKLNTKSSSSSREDASQLLKKLCMMAKGLQPQTKHNVYQTLINNAPFFEACTGVLLDQNATVTERCSCAEALKSSLDHSPAELRSFIVSSGGHPKEGPRSTSSASGAKVPVDKTKAAAAAVEEGGTSTANKDGAGDGADSQVSTSLLFALVTRLSADRDTGMLQHVCEILKQLLDPESMEPQQKDEFLGLFYDHYMSWVIDPLQPANSAALGSCAAAGAGAGEDEAVAAARNHLCEILAYCVQSHGYRIKYFILRTNLVSKVLKLIQFRDGKYTYVGLGAIRFARACVGIKDEFYNRYIAKNDLFRPIFDTFKVRPPPVTHTQIAHTHPPTHTYTHTHT